MAVFLALSARLSLPGEFFMKFKGLVKKE